MKKQNVDERLERKKAQAKCLIPHVKPGKIVEFGCGSGFILEMLSSEFSDSVIVGIDKSMEQLETVASKDLRNVIPVQADISENIFPRVTFDTALFVACLHEVFSYSGKEKVLDAFRIAHAVLKDDGVLIVQDFLKPISDLVHIAFKEQETKNKFIRFADEFRPREVRFEETEKGVKLDIADAVEFISKYNSSTEEDWKEEMEETHFFFTEEDYRETARKTGFAITDLMRLPKDQYWCDEVRKDIEFAFGPEFKWIQLVLMKEKCGKENRVSM
jgi:cyclopropane fatty-acyl-phospholipid synthase-like methyltransferase